MDGNVYFIIDYFGVVVDYIMVKENYNVLKDVWVFVRFYFGIMSVVLKEVDIVDLVLFFYYGGNIDDWCVIEGVIMYYLVFVLGVLLLIGDLYVG